MRKLLDLFRYKGPIPQMIKVRAQSLATQTNTYVAFNKDGTCHMFPVRPMRLDLAGVWIPSGRKGMFQSEEIKFTKHKYKYTDWKELITPDHPIDTTFTHKTYTLTRKVTKENRL